MKMRQLIYHTVLIVLMNGFILQAQNWVYRNPRPHGERFISMAGVGDSVLAATENDIIQFSSDGGTTWEIRKSKNISRGGLLYALKNGRIYLSNRAGFLAMTDNWGRSWMILRDEDINYETRALVFFDNDTGMIVSKVADSGIIERSFNGGVTWTKKSDTVGVITGSYYVSGSSAFICGYKRVSSGNSVEPRLYYTSDKGATWERWANLPNYVSRVYKCAFKDRLYGIIATDNGLFLTLDGGSTWKSIKTSYYTFNVQISFDRTFKKGFIVHGGSGNVVSRSVDSGMTWVSVLSGLPKGEEVNRVYYKGGDNILVFGNGGLIYMSDDGGTIWKKVHGFGPHYNFTMIHFSSELNGVAMGQGSEYAITTDGGMIWSEKEFQNNISLVDVDFIDLENAKAVAKDGSGQYILISTKDGGFSWNTISSIPVKNYSGFGLSVPRKIKSMDAESIMIGAAFGVVYSSSNAGFNWNIRKIFPDFITTVYSIEAYNNEAWVSYNNFVTGTHDGFHSFYVVDPAGIDNDTPVITDIMAMSASEVILCGYVVQGVGEKYVFLRTMDGGLRWNSYQGAKGTKFYFINKKIGFVFDNSGYSKDGFITEDGGISWSGFEIPRGIRTLYFFNKDRGWGAGVQGKIMQYYK